MGGVGTGDAEQDLCGDLNPIVLGGTCSFGG